MHLTILTAMVLIFASNVAMAQDRAKLQKLVTELGVSKWTLFTCVRGAGGALIATPTKRNARPSGMLYTAVSLTKIPS